MSTDTQPFRSWDAAVLDWQDIASAAGSRRASWGVELTVVRHGETTANARQLITGVSDPPLTARGIAQAMGLGSLLAEGAYDVAFHSGLRRSRETLEAAYGDRELGLVLSDPRLAERSMGVLEGKPRRPLPAYDRGDLSWAPAGGEPYVSVARRVVSFLLDLISAAIAAGRHLQVLAASHVGTMRILSGILDRTADPADVMTRQFANAEPIRFTFRSVDWPPFINGQGESR